VGNKGWEWDEGRQNWGTIRQIMGRKKLFFLIVIEDMSDMRETYYIKINEQQS
jgi:hypothetical protein